MQLSSNLYFEIIPEKKYKYIIDKNWVFLRNDLNIDNNNLLPENNFTLLIIKFADKVKFSVLKPHREKIPLENIKSVSYFGTSILPIFDIKKFNFPTENNLKFPELVNQDNLKSFFSSLNELIIKAIYPEKNKEIDVMKIIHHLKNDPDLRINEILKKLNFNERKLQRKFKNITGINMKQYAMIEKFKESTDKLALEGVYEDLKYYDQPNFIKEFKKLSGRNPTEFIKLQRKIKKDIIDG